MKKQLCGFQCLVKHMCFQVAGQGWNSPVRSSLPRLTLPVVSTPCNQPGLLHSLGPGLELLKAASFSPLLPPTPYPLSIINPTSPDLKSQWGRPALATPKVLKQQPIGHFKSGEVYWEGRVGQKAEAEGH